MNKNFVTFFLVLVLGLMIVGFVSGAVVNEEVLKAFDDGAEKVAVIVDKNINFNGIRTMSDVAVEKTVEQDDKFSAYVSEKELEILMSDPKVKEVRMNFPLRAFLGESVVLVGADSVWNLKINSINLSGISQSVCILDTGINITHPDFAGRILVEKCFCSVSNVTVGGGCCPDNTAEDDSAEDDNGHGTHVGGIVGASGGINGIAGDVGLVIVKIMNGSGDGNSLDLENGIQWCLDNAATYNISVITASLGGAEKFTSENQSDCDNKVLDLTSKINAAFVENISVTIANGNSDWIDGISWPACISNATPVGAVDKSDNLYYSRSSFVKLFGIGVNVNSTVGCCSYNKYKSWSGTSMATPMVAGAIALINQYLSLSGQIKTPSEIEDILYGTGLQFNESSNNFSRINVHSAILSLDVDAPNVTLVSPINNHINLTFNQTFTCNATDWQLANVTLKIWNSTGLYNSTTNNLTGTENQTLFNLTNMPEGTYDWNCFVIDVEENLGNAMNYTLTIGGIVVNLTSPENNSYTNINQTNFTCNLTSEETYNLSNVTFYLWNSTGNLINMTTKNISGINNGTIFNWTLSEETNYSWNCMGVNNVSYNSSAENNFTITYDVTAPVINLSEVADGTSTTIEFSFNVSDSNPVSNCSVYVDSSETLNMSVINNSGTNFISVSGLSVATHSAYVNCSDGAGNIGNSSIVLFTISSSSDVPNLGGGSSSPTPKIYSADNSKMISGYSVKLKAKDKISFKLASGEHSLKILKVESNSADIIVESEPIYLTLTVGEEIKLNLSSQNYYDFYVKLNEIKYGKANVSIMRIFEEIVKKVEVDEDNEKNEIYHTMDSEVVETEGLMIRDYFWVIVVLIILIVAVIRLNRKKLKILKSKKKYYKRKKLKASKSKKKHGKRKKIKT